MNPEAHRFCFFENGLGFAPESAELRENRDFGGFRGTEFWNKVFFKFRKSRKYLDCSEVLRSTKKSLGNHVKARGAVLYHTILNVTSRQLRPLKLCSKYGNFVPNHDGALF